MVPSPGPSAPGPLRPLRGLRRRARRRGARRDAHVHGPCSAARRPGADHRRRLRAAPRRALRGGRATAWAAAARPGDRVTLIPNAHSAGATAVSSGGPRRRTRPRCGCCWPGTRLRAGDRVRTGVAAAGLRRPRPAGGALRRIQDLATASAVEVRWVATPTRTARGSRRASARAARRAHGAGRLGGRRRRDLTRGSRGEAGTVRALRRLLVHEHCVGLVLWATPAHGAGRSCLTPYGPGGAAEQSGPTPRLLHRSTCPGTGRRERARVFWVVDVPYRRR